MSDDFLYSRDTWFAQLPIDSANNVLVFTDTSVTNQTITVPTSKSGADVAYYNKRTSAVAGDYYGVLNEIQSAINTASTHTYEFRAYTPLGYPAPMGLKLVQTAGSGAFTWNFTNASWTFNARILGYGDASPSSDHSSKQSEIASPYSTYGTWVSHTIDGGEATDKIRRRNKRIVMSGTDHKYADRKQYHDRDYRTMRYDWVPGAHVRKNRGDDLASANTGEIKQYDVNNAFEDIWDLATRSALADGVPEGVEVGKLAHVEVHHNMSDILGSDTSTVEALRLSDEGQITDFDECVNLQRMAGEYYTVDVDTLILASNYDQ